MGSNQDKFINVIKSILTESLDFSGNNYFNPEMYYFITLYIINNEFEFYSEDIFKFFLFKGFVYFSNQKLLDEDKMYVKIFEGEIENWEISMLYGDFENIIIELLESEKWKIVKNLQKNRYTMNNIEKHIDKIARKVNRKFKHKNITGTKEEIIEKLFDLF